MNQPLTDLDYIARREAGHAVVGSALGLRLISVTVERDAGAYGRCSWADIGEDRMRRQRALMIAAGPCAESLLRGSSPEGVSKLIGALDRHRECDDELQVVAGPLGGDEVDQYTVNLDDLITEATELIEWWAVPIERVSRALVVRRTLTGDRVRKIIARYG